MKISKLFSFNVILAVLFIVLGVVTRTIYHVAPNVEFVTAISILSGYFLAKKRFSFVITLFIMVITDLIIGNSAIFLFTWSAFLLTPVFGILASKLLKRSSNLTKTVCLSSTSIFSTIMFFLWTNSGVVLTTNMYEKNLSGVVQSYINGLPFLKNQLFGNVLITPALFLITIVALKLVEALKNNYKTKLAS